MNVKVYSDIANQAVFDALGIKRKVFSAEAVKDILEKNPQEKEFRFDINCNGGSVREGFAIYDLLRTSGKNIYCNIDGACHSMAVCILLAAPKSNRTANPQATALIHDVRMIASGEITTGQAENMLDNLKRERERILNLYHERTGYPKDKLENIMLEEKERSAAELLQWGFINNVNSYTTNFKTATNMSKEQNLLREILNYFKGKVTNYAFTDADGSTLFSTEKEDDSLAVGDIATPDGTFELPDGRIVTIFEGVVTEIIEPATIEDLQAENAKLKADLETSNALLLKAQNALREAANIRSLAKIQARMGADGKAGVQNKALTPEERKAAARQGRDKFNGKKEVGNGK